MSGTPQKDVEEGSEETNEGEEEETEETEMTQSRHKMWRKRTSRYMFFTGIAGTLLFLGLSFVKPHVTTIIDWAFGPCVLYAGFLACQYYQFRKEFKEQLEER